MYAKWNVNTYKVTFDANGGSAVNTTMTVTYDTKYGTLPTTTLAHNEFLGWYTAKTGGTKITSESIVKITSNSTFYAHWQTVTAPVITGGGVNYAPSRTISVSTAGTASSGINAYEYYISTASTSPVDATKATGTTTNTYVFNKNGNSYIWYRTVSKGGIKSVWSNVQQARIDTDKPEADMRVETINGEKYLVFDTYDTISGIDKLLDKDGKPIASKEIPLKIYVNGYGTADRTDTNNYEQLMKDMGYTNYSINQGSYPTAATLKSGGYNVFVDNKNVWAASETLNTYFANGINVVSVGNDSTSVLTPISVNYATTEPSVYSPKISNVFTKKLGVLDNGASQMDSRQRIKFASGTEVLYKEVFDSDGSEYDGIGYYTANGTKWIHSQMALNSSLLPFIDASLSYMSNKGLYYYKLEYKGVNNFTLYDKAGNIKELSYDYSKTLPNLSVANSELYSAYNSYSPTNVITYDGNGALTVTSSDTGIASVSLSGKTITIKGGSKVGTATITVKAAETSVYNSRQVTFTVNNRLPSTLAWGTGSIKGKTITLPFTYTGDGTLSVSVNDSSIGTATVNATNKTVTVNALSVGQLVVTLKSSTGNQYYQSSITKKLTFGDAADSNSTAFQEALTTWGTIGTATDANWYGSKTDANIVAPDGSYVILESVNTNNYTGYYFKEKQPDGTYKVPSYKDITLDFDMTSPNGDDDAMGAMIRFNPESTANYWSGYLLFLDKHDSNSGIGNGAANGLWRANNKQFSDSGLRTNSTKLVTNPAIVWTRKQWTHYKFQAKGTKITVWSWPTNPNGKYVVSDQAKIFEFNDTSASAIKSGTYGFWTYSQPYTQFKNFVAVTSNGEDFEITIED